jgi:hypothetical protein
MIDVDRKESPQKAQTSSLSKDTSRKEWEYEEDLAKVYSRCQNILTPQESLAAFRAIDGVFPHLTLNASP